MKYAGYIAFLCALTLSTPARAWFENTCRVGQTLDGHTLFGSCHYPEDRSWYILPAVTRDGVRLVPTLFRAYYEASGINYARQGILGPVPFPPAFSMASSNWQWRCPGDPPTGTTPPLRCADGLVELDVNFPSRCLASDGTTTKPPKSVCPLGTMPLPHLVWKVRFKVGWPVGDVRIAPGPATYTNGWEQGELADLVATCCLPGINCGYL